LALSKILESPLIGPYFKNSPKSLKDFGISNGKKKEMPLKKRTSRVCPECNAKRHGPRSKCSLKKKTKK